MTSRGRAMSETVATDDTSPLYYAAMKDRKTWDMAREMIDALGYERARADAQRFIRLFDITTETREDDEPRRYFFVAVEEAIDVLHHMPEYVPEEMQVAT